MNRLRSTWSHVRAKIAHSRLKKILSLMGATIILATFIAKDVRTDKLKELEDALEVAENTFNIEHDEQRTYQEVSDLRDRFDEFASHPAKSLPEDTFYALLLDLDSLHASGGNCHTLYRMLTFLDRDQSAFENMVRLAKKLPEDIRNRFDIASVNRQYKSANNLVEVTLHPCRNPPVKTPTQANISQAADEVFGASALADDISKKVITAAAQERDRAETSSEGWTAVYYSLFAIGWIVSVAGILIGEDAAVKSVSNQPPP